MLMLVVSLSPKAIVFFILCHVSLIFVLFSWCSQVSAATVTCSLGSVLAVGRVLNSTLCFLQTVWRKVSTAASSSAISFHLQPLNTCDIVSYLICSSTDVDAQGVNGCTRPQQEVNTSCSESTFPSWCFTNPWSSLVFMMFVWLQPIKTANNSTQKLHLLLFVFCDRLIFLRTLNILLNCSSTSVIIVDADVTGVCVGGVRHAAVFASRPFVCGPPGHKRLMQLWGSWGSEDVHQSGRKRLSNILMDWSST